MILQSLVHSELALTLSLDSWSRTLTALIWVPNFGEVEAGDKWVCLQQSLPRIPNKLGDSRESLPSPVSDTGAWTGCPGDSQSQLGLLWGMLSEAVIEAFLQ